MTSSARLVTITTPCRNHGRFIRHTIESVLGQDYPHIEYLVFDGGSTDETIPILKEYGSRVRWRSEPDRGQSDAINKGFRAARGDIVAWLNADDTYVPGAVSTAVRAFETHPETKLVYGEGHLMTESGAILGPFPHSRPFDLWKLVKVIDYIQQPSAFIHRDALQAVGGVDESLNWCMDWDLWIRIGTRFPVTHVDARLSNARIYLGTKTSQGGLARVREIVSMLTRHNARLGTRESLGLVVGYVKSQTYDRLMRGLHVTPMFAADWRRRVREVLFDSQGVYDDGSLGRSAHFLFPFGQPIDAITFELERPPAAAGPLRVAAFGGGQLLARHVVAHGGRFSVTVPYSRTQRHPLEVTLTFDRTFGQGLVWRRRACMLRNITWQRRDD
jgi:glycosyltransferase involved in cell wall biosynthesis